ncbi:minor tail protein [Sporosarcina phage Lietuvens]|nr:minor tail protein [Sporosarcina phage Lietuvens]
MVARLRLQDDLSGKMRKVSGSLGDTEKRTRSLTDRMGGLKTALAGVGASVGLLQIGKSIIGVGVAFDTQMSKVKAISGATEDQFQSLRHTARQLGKDTKYTMTEAGEAMEYLALA